MAKPLPAEALEFLDGCENPVARLEIYPPANSANSLLRLSDAEARKTGEEAVQLMEGLRYEYAFVGTGAENFRLEEEFGKGAVVPSSNPRLAHCGSIATGLNTGRLALVARNATGEIVGRVALEIRSRKEGYREVYQAWLKFDMAARLVWHGGDDVYGAGQRDIATLYEYWVFFKLLNIVSAVLKLEKPAAHALIEETTDGFGLKLKSGEQLAFDGVTFGGARPLRVRFSYNRSFISQFRARSGWIVDRAHAPGLLVELVAGRVLLSRSGNSGNHGACAF